jgi:hypothetical protein
VNELEELQLWRERAAAKAAGRPWAESDSVSVGGTMREGAAARAAVSSGAAVHCRQCSSPHQRVFHEPRPRRIGF